MSNWYKFLMDANRNPLANLPPAQRFQIMIVLSVMWTTIFCASLGAWMFYGQLIVGHVLFLLGVLFTGLAFGNAQRVRATYRDHPRSDGTARYDDVWGA